MSDAVSQNPTEIYAKPRMTESNILQILSPRGGNQPLRWVYLQKKAILQCLLPNPTGELDRV